MQNNKIIRLFDGMFFCLLGILFIQVAFGNKIYIFDGWWVLISVASWLFFCRILYAGLQRYHSLFERHEKRFLCLFFLFLTSGHFTLGYLLALETAWDTEAVYKGAVSLATGQQLGRYTEYFHIFPHNLGAALLLGKLFQLSQWMGFNNFYQVGVFYNVLSIDIGILLVYFICKKLKNVATAWLALCLCLGCLPLHFYTPLFYTDTLSLPFVAAAYFSYLHLQQSSMVRRVGLGALLGVILAVGGIIKATVLICALVFLIDALIRNKLIKYVPSIAASLLVFLAITKPFDAYRLNGLLNKDELERKRTPYIHWIMMGLAGNGSYNGEDYGYTGSFGTQAEKTNAAKERIQQRLHAYGLLGYLEFLNRKQQVNFGSGIYGVNEMIDDGPIRPNIVHQFCLEGGRYFNVFKNMAQGFHVFLFLLITLAALLDCARKNPCSQSIFAARLGVLGIYAFLLLWEANSRYILNFMPLFVVCAAVDAGRVLAFLSQVRRNLLQAVISPSSQAM